jgi:regulator of sigma D
MTNIESMERLNSKVARFTKFIPGRINKDYSISFDESIPTRGEWDPVKKVITFNPVLVATTTTGHEIFHILFDILYHSNPKLLNQGIEQVKNSEKITSIVDKRYSHITDINTKNSEYLAYAVGNETERLFADYEKHSKFTRWLMRLYFYIKSKLGITKDAIRQMSEIIVYSNTSIKGNIPSIQDSVYKGLTEERITEKNDIYQRLSEMDKEDRTELGKLKTKVIQVLERRAKIYTRTGRIQAAVNELEILKDTILNASDNKHVLLSIARFIKQADNDITDSYNKYLDLIRKESRGEKVFTTRILDRIRQNVEGYRILDDIANLLADLEYPNNREGYKARGNIMSGKNYITKDLEYINAIKGKRDQLSSLYITKGLKTLSDFLSPYHTHMYIQFKDKVETDYNQLKSKGKTTQTLDEYTQDRLKAEEENLKKLTTLNIERELLKASKDINGLQRWLETVFDSNDAIVSSMVKAFETADFKSQDKTQKVFRQLVETTKELEDYFNSSKLTSVNSAEFYSFMLEKDSLGNPTGYITKEVMSTFWDARKKVINDARDKAVKSGKSVEQVQRAIDKALTVFNKKNAPYKVVDFNKMQKSMLEYINTLYKSGVVKNGVTLKMTRPEYNFYLEEIGKRMSDLNFEATVPYNKYREYGVREEIIAELDEWRRLNAFKYRTLKPQWVNKEYKTLMDLDINDPRRKFYDLIVSISEDVEEGLPFIHRLRGRLPGIEKTGSERLSEGQGIVKTLVEKAKEATNVRPDETERGDTTSKLELVNEDKEPIHYLPVYFTSNISPKDQSYDLATIYYDYFRMAIDFKEKFEILPELEMARYFVNNRDYIKRDSNGNFIIDAISSTKEPTTEKGKGTNLAQQLNDWFEASLYGIRRKGEGQFTIPILGLTVDVAKAVDLMNKYTSISMLGLNFVGGTANFLLGEAQDVIEAAGKEFYSPKSFAKANGFYAKNLPAILGDIGSRVPTNIVSAINIRFDVLNEYENGNIRENSKFKRLMHSDSLFFNMHSGEHAIQSTVALAMLEEMRAKDSKGNDIGSMLSNLKSVKGELVIDPKVVNFTLDDQAKYKMQLKRVLSGMHGEYYRNAAEAWQRLSLFRTAMLFRKFLVPGFKRRWGKLGINELKGTYTEGYYRTFGRYITELVTSTRALGLSGAGESWDQLHSWEKANVRRMLTELVFLASAIVLARVFTKLSDDDDDDDGFTNFLAYQALRMRSELAFYLSPPAAMQILRSPAASVTMAESLLKFFGDLTYPIMSGTMEFDRYEQGNRKGQLKLTKSVTDLTPLYKQYYRFKYISDQLSWFR